MKDHDGRRILKECLVLLCNSIILIECEGKKELIYVIKCMLLPSVSLIPFNSTNMDNNLF